MTPRDRILATLGRHGVDRIPVDVWLTPEVLTSLQKHVGVGEELELYRELGVDKIVWIFPGYGRESFDPNESTGRDPWGVPTHEVQAGAATYLEYGEGPLADMSEPAELDDYPLWPDPDKFNYAAARRNALHARELGFATIGPWISHFEIYCHMRGMENALIDTIAEPEFLNATLDRIESIQTVMLERCMNELGDLLDMVFISDDLGTQQGLLMSVEAWQEHLRARLERWAQLIHKHGKKVLFHTDGAARDIVPHLIDAGIDILNPIQHVCPGMECRPLNEDFGERVIFHGGIDNQHVLPFGSVEDVRREVTNCLETLGRDGGYIPASCHNIQAGTPPENVIAMIETVREWTP